MKRILLTLAISGLLYGVSYATPGDGDDKGKTKKECKKAVNHVPVKKKKAALKASVLAVKTKQKNNFFSF